MTSERSNLVNLLLNSTFGSGILLSLVGALPQDPPRYEGCFPMNNQMQNMTWYLHQYWLPIFLVSLMGILYSYFLKKRKKVSVDKPIE